MRFSYLNIKNSTAAAWILILGFVCYVLLWYRMDWPAGGQDSWNHFLYARWSFKHPELMLDQWGKPLFTIPVIPFTFLGMPGLYIFNIASILLAAWLCYLTSRKLGMRLPWMAAAFMVFQPIVFSNVISGLTEPINALALAFVIYAFASNKWLTACVVASFLPYFRSEGFVLLIAVLIYLVARRKAKLILYLLTGSAIFTLFGGLLFGNWAFIIDQNPYLRFEKEGKFDPGHGDFWHYTNSYQHILGLALSILLGLALLLLIGHLVYLLQKKTPEEKSRFSFWLLAPLFLGFFLAHSFLWWSGSMGSHGLTRVFLVVAPTVALLAHYAFDRLLSFDIRLLGRSLPLLLLLLCIYLAYKGSEMPAPWQKSPISNGKHTEMNVVKAIEFIRANNLGNKVLVHQIPFINVKYNLDPWEKPEKAKTLYLWSLDITPGKDWFPDSSVVIWDGFHAVRDAPMPLDTLRKIGTYHEIAYFPDADSIYDVRIFVKSKKIK